MMQKMTVYIFDLDGTLLDRNSKISSRCLSVLRRIQEREDILCIATGRPIFYVRELPIPRPYFAVTVNGAQTYHCTEHGETILSEETLPPLVVEKCLSLFEAGEMQSLTFLEGDQESLVPQRPSNALIRGPSRRCEDELRRSPVTLERRRNSISVLPLGTSKYKACKELFDYASRIVAFGDNSNDYELLTILADIAHCPRNAVKALRDHPRVKTSSRSHHEDFVYYCLREELSI